MSQTLHIFRKDATHLRYEIAAVLTLAALYTAANVREAHGMWWDQGRYDVGSSFGWLLGIAWAYLLVRAVHGEALPGDRQFWLTRPYSRTSLFASKILFALMFVSLPMLISDMVTLSANGFPPASHIGGLAWKQLLFTMTIVLPPLAMASVTRNLGEAILASLGFCVVVMVGVAYIEGYEQGRDGYRWAAGESWIRDARVYALVALVAIVIVALQYFRRATVLARTTGIVAGALFWVIWAVPSSRAEVSYGLLHADPSEDTSWLQIAPRNCGGCPTHDARDSHRILLPVVVTGVPEGTFAEISAVTIFFAPGTRKVIRTGVQPGNTKGDWFIAIDLTNYPGVKDQPTTLKTEVYFKISRRRVGPLPLEAAATEVPGIGYCAELGGGITCRSPLRWPGKMIIATMGVVVENFDEYRSTSPFPTGSPLTAVSSYLSRSSFHEGTPPDPSATFFYFEPVDAHRTLEWKNIRLTDFEK